MELQTFEDITSDNFDGRFYFTNPFDEDWTALWNNKEYFFPAKKTVPLVILGETLENIQEIRKRGAYRLAEREWFKSSDYKKMSKMGNGLPPTRNDAVLQPLIDQCLKPMPVTELKARKAKNNLDTPDHKFKNTKAMGESDDPGELFREENRKVRSFGRMSDKA